MPARLDIIPEAVKSRRVSGLLKSTPVMSIRISMCMGISSVRNIFINMRSNYEKT